MNLNQMNQAQQQAVLHGEGPLLVLAGPGSGKTFTITQRILYLIEELQVPPEEILVITFTKEAALSMQRRFGESTDRSYPVNFGTFHSIFYHILKDAGVFGTGPILAESQKKKLIFPIIKKYHKSAMNEKDVDGQSISSEDITLLLSAISYYKNTGNIETAAQKVPAEWRTHFAQVYSEYENARMQQKVLDFDDMVYECEKLLQRDTGVRTYWQKRFSHILMDEFQDICPRQYSVVKLLTRSPYNLFAVGDDDQAIYGFRGSEPECIRRFVDDYKAKQILLNVNYRSTQEIVKASLIVVEDNQQRFVKRLKACSKEKGNVFLHHFQEREEEYAYLLKRFSDCINKNKETYAVLFRTNAQMQRLAVRLKREGIPYEMKEKAVSVYEHFVVQDVMAYLRVAMGDCSRKAMLRIINKPQRYISREALAEQDMVFGTMPAKIHGKSVWEERRPLQVIKEYYNNYPSTGSAFPYLNQIRREVQLLEKHLEYLRKATPYLAVQYISRVIGYENYLKTQCLRLQKGQEVLEDWLEMLNWLREDGKQYQTAKEWLEAQKAFRESMAQRNTPKQSLQEQAVPQLHLMTVHASKGLEFDRVWIPDCNERVYPYGNMPDRVTCEEERRILYVAMTRAKKSLELLYLTGTKERPRLPSSFLNSLKHYSSTTSSNSQLSRYSSNASATASYSSSSSI